MSGTVGGRYGLGGRPSPIVSNCRRSPTARAAARISPAPLQPVIVTDGEPDQHARETSRCDIGQASLQMMVAAAAADLGIGSGLRRLEGLNSLIRLTRHRSLGFHSPAPLIALVYLFCCVGVQIPLPR